MTDCDAWLITGSASGVYDPEPFIPPLIEFVRAAAEAQIPTVGICFGHQIVAQSLGGEAIKSDKGWGIGTHRYSLYERPVWLPETLAAPEFDTYVSHQDQVVALPPGAKVLAGNDFCPNAMLTVGNTILTLQSHPEMSSAYAGELYDVRRPRLGDARVDAALETLADAPHAPDADRVAAWIGAFISHALKN